MGIFKKKKIQSTEGEISNVLLESLLTGTALNSAGTERIYRSYAAQTNAIYKKYNGRDELGNWQLRSVIDTRSAFIAGEGLSIICKDDVTAKFFDDFMRLNKLYGSRFINAVKQCEMEGQELLYLRPDKDNQNVKVFRHVSNYGGGKQFNVLYGDMNNPDDIKDITIKQKNGEEKSLKDKFVLVITGGDGSNLKEPTTRAGLILWEIESYDRSKNAMRKNNHLFGKITPFFNSENPQDVANFRSQAKAKDWKIGDVMAALNGDLKMIVPDVGAMENLKAEQISCSKAIAATTGIPVHWFGHVDLMSNRATAAELYETINNATILDRVIWQEAIFDLLVKAQEMAIDRGYLESVVNTDFEVKIPLISFSKMKDHIQALSIAYSDEAISIQDYRNHLPGINPYKTEQMIEGNVDDALTGLKINRSDINDGESQEN